MPEWGGRHWRNMALAVAVLTLGFVLVQGLWPPSARRQAPREPEKADLAGRMDEIRSLLERLPAMDEEARDQAADSIVSFFTCDVRFGLARRQEETYAVVDDFVGGRLPFSAPFRETQRLIDGRSDALAERAGKRPFDAVRFSREGIALLGILEAHLELEEAVLMPLYFRAVSPPEFRARREGGVSKSGASF